MDNRYGEIKQGVRLGLRQVRAAEIAGDPSTVAECLEIIKSAVQFVVKDVSASELSIAIIETLNELDSEHKSLEPLARFCEERIARAVEQVYPIPGS
jgi:hypothetical protein